MSASKSEFNNESTKKTLSGMINYTWLSHLILNGLMIHQKIEMIN